MHDLPVAFKLADRNAVVSAALAAVIDRTMPDGQPWCPPQVARQLVDLVIRRDDRLAKAIHGSVRLACLLRTIDGRRHWAPLYRSTAGDSVYRLTTTAFKSLVSGAAAAGRLEARCFDLFPMHVSFKESKFHVRAVRGQHAGVLSFSSMPLSGALLAFLHEALGVAEVDRQIEGLIAAHDRDAAHRVGGDLARAVDAWLTRHLSTAHHMRQARAIRSYLAKKEKYRPELIDDEVILGFWEHQAQDGEHNDDFRLFTTVARKLICYRSIMFSEATVRGLEEAVDIYKMPGAGDTSIASDSVVDDDWRSPLVGLTAMPASAIKWLTATERRRLQNFLGSGADDAADDRATASKSSDGKQGLASGERFDFRLWQTLLRADVFGPEQGRLIQSVRDGSSPREAVDVIGANLSSASYDATIEDYRVLRRHVMTAMFAALDALISLGSPASASLAMALASDGAKCELRDQASQVDTDDDDDDTNGRANLIAAHIAGVLQRVARSLDETQSELGSLITAARAARRNLRRKGFEPGVENGHRQGFEAAVTPLVQLASELDALIAVLETGAAKANAVADSTRFLTAFEHLYVRVLADT